MFADDLAVRMNGTDRAVPNIKLAEAIGTVDEWCFDNKLCLNAPVKLKIFKLT